MVGGKVPRISLRAEKQFLQTVASIVGSGLAESAHDISKGGLAVAAAEMAILGRRGVSIDLDKVPTKASRLDQQLFSESKPRIILESKAKNTARILRRLKTAKINAAKIGRVEGKEIFIESHANPIVQIPLEEATDVWSRTLSRAMEAEL